MHRKEGTMDKEIRKVTVEYEDGTVKELKKGCCVDLTNVEDELHVDMIECKPFDIVRLAYGLLICVERIGMTPLLKGYLSGEALPDEEEEE